MAAKKKTQIRQIQQKTNKTYEKIKDFALPAWVANLYAAFLSLITGWMAHWKVFEFDLFFNVRQGEEILKTGRVQTVDTWSHSYFGESCINFEWLSTIVQYLAAAALPDYQLSGWLRSGLVWIWSFFIVKSVQRHSSSQINFLAAAPLFLFWIFAISSFRLQMRPDLFATCFYVLLLAIWYGDFTETKKKIYSLVTLLLWANFHGVTVTIGIFIYSAFVFFSDEKGETFKDKIKWLLLGTLTYFCTPLGYLVLLPIYHLFFTSAQINSVNPDVQPFTLKLLELAHGNWHFRLWFVYIFLAAAAYLTLIFYKPLLLPKIFQNKMRFLSVALTLTFGTFLKIRLIHYQVVFLLPIIIAALSVLMEQKRFYKPLLGTIGAGLGFLCFIVFPQHIIYSKRPLGEGIDENLTPINSTAFIKKIKPEKNLLNAFEFGGYLIAELRDYPVALDGRGAAENMVRQMNEASKSQSSSEEFLNRYNINTVLETIPQTYQDASGKQMDSHEYFFPRDKWALVFFDNVSVLYIRRIPAHEKIIETYEYKTIRRGLPAGYGAFFPGLSDEERKANKEELLICLKRHQSNLFCKIGLAAFYQKEQNLPAARALLTEAEKISSYEPELLFHLMQIDEELGNKEEATKWRKRFEKLVRAIE